ncbi:MAG: NAD(P)-binding domain-containing protein [Microcoleus sp. PH2017_15_JOR_U_A]|uniref:NADPH-dependent F420 reductase n=1 Tax=unclassified Microcoleus TaxID=2642155 RepID=UPI001D85F235|nr:MULTISPECIES: NAD(P)-binding domain-containing protein [unclassified Microcoleus]MCC3500973.1 NAD(P)-binding domain-containing protein [Microcoleus sp. PH2017_15_JOR_U_A]MCC3585087.1 NAD(P)-binding domain-containing protein [Microcoleus sp. PH2017_30_WIL_O_A]
MKVGFWGSGNMSRVLGGAWAVAGHQIVFGSRDVEKSRVVAEEIGFSATGGTNDEVAESCEVIISTVRAVPSSFLTSTAALAGKVIIDLNNRDFPRDYKPEEFLNSLAEVTQRDVPSAKVVKALNNQAMEVFNCDAETLRKAGVQGFFAGDDHEARQITIELLNDLGLKPVDFGSLSNAWLLELQADILRTYMFATGNFLVMPGFIEVPHADPRFGERRKGTY